jgi:hypothetical protein
LTLPGIAKFRVEFAEISKRCVRDADDIVLTE